MMLVSWLSGQRILGYFSYIVEDHLGVVPPTSGLGPLIPVNSEDIRHAHRSIIFLGSSSVEALLSDGFRLR